MSNHPRISIVSPVYKAQGIVQELVDRIIENTLKVTENFEIILVRKLGLDEAGVAHLNSDIGVTQIGVHALRQRHGRRLGRRVPDRSRKPSKPGQTACDHDMP